jgi:hypothetical protein
MGRLRKRCRFCRRMFLPDPRTKGKQIACLRQACRRQRKKEGQEAQARRNPGYFKGRYANTRKWLDEHPGYITEYRDRNPLARQKHRECERRRRKRHQDLAVDIQDVISTQEIEDTELSCHLPSVDIQDAIQKQVFVCTGLISRLRRVDIQDPIDLTAAGCYKQGKLIWSCASRGFLERTG